MFNRHGCVDLINSLIECKDNDCHQCRHTVPDGQRSASTVEEGIVEQGKEEYHTCPQQYQAMVRVALVGAVHYMQPLGKGGIRQSVCYKSYECDNKIHVRIISKTSDLQIYTFFCKRQPPFPELVIGEDIRKVFFIHIDKIGDFCVNLHYEYKGYEVV